MVILYFDHLTNGGNKKFFIQKEGEYIYCNTCERIVSVVIEKIIMTLNCMTMRVLELQIKYLFFFEFFLKIIKVYIFIVIFYMNLMGFVK